MYIIKVYVYPFIGIHVPPFEFDSTDASIKRTPATPSEIVGKLSNFLGNSFSSRRAATAIANSE